MYLLLYTPSGVPLPEQFPSKSLPTREVVKGPGSGRHGTVYGIGSAEGEQLGYYADGQDWFQCPETKVWYGWAKSKKPGPEDLAREKMLDGHATTMADGKQWIIPVVRQFMEGKEGITYRSALPQYHKLDDDGNWTYSEVVAGHSALYEFAQRWWDIFFAPTIDSVDDDDADTIVDKKAETVTIQWAAEACYAALSTNYNLTRHMLSNLQLVDSTIEGEILNALIDLPTLSDLTKKNEQPDA